MSFVWTGYSYAADPVIITDDVRVKMEFKDTKLTDALDALSYLTGIPCIINNKLEGNVTMRFSNMTFTETLNLLAKSFDFNWALQDGVVMITPAETMTNVKTFTLKNMNLTKAQEKLATFIKKEKIFTNSETNTISVDATPYLLEKAERVLAEEDTPPTQIMIQAQMIEVNRDLAEKLGFKYSWNKYDSAATPWKFTYTTTFDAEKIFTNGTIISRPNVTTFNGTEATVNMAEKVPVMTTDIANDGSKSSTVTFENVGVTMKVTPRVNEDPYITLKINPSVSAITKYIESNNVSAPQISTREANTTVRVKSGETIIIGGLLKKEEIENITKIPYLSKLPLFGRFFTHKDVDSYQSEVFIFVTPYILKENTETKTTESKN